MCFTILVLFFLFCSIYLFHSVFMYFLFFLLVCWIDTNRLPLFFSNNVMWNVNIYQYLKTMAMHTVFGWFILWSEDKKYHSLSNYMRLLSVFNVRADAFRFISLFLSVFNCSVWAYNDYGNQTVHVHSVHILDMYTQMFVLFLFGLLLIDERRPLHVESNTTNRIDNFLLTIN